MTYVIWHKIQNKNIYFLIDIEYNSKIGVNTMNTIIGELGKSEK